MAGRKLFHSDILSTEVFYIHDVLLKVYFFPKQQILDFSKLKEFADDNFKFDKNGRNVFKRVENTVGKGEIACYEQFVLFPLCFQKTGTADT